MSSPQGLDEATAAQLKTCCADLYSNDWVRLLIGDSFHPGGEALTERLAALVGIDAGSRVLDVASGRGSSAIHLARRLGCSVVGVDLSATSVAAASRLASEAGVGDRVSFLRGDAEALELEPASFDALICECAFCTFPDKPAAARRMARLLRPGGRVGLSDLTRRGELPEALHTLLAWVACIADALPVEEYRRHLEAAGFAVDAVEPVDEALGELVDGIRRKLAAADLMVQLRRLDLPGADLPRAREMAREAVRAIAAGRLGYALISGTRTAG